MGETENHEQVEALKRELLHREKLLDNSQAKRREQLDKQDELVEKNHALWERCKALEADLAQERSVAAEYAARLKRAERTIDELSKQVDLYAKELGAYRKAREEDLTLDPLDVADVAHQTTRVLDRAKALVCGDRAADYGDPNQSFGRIARLWRAYLDLPETIRLDARDVAQMMIVFKAARDRHQRKPDNPVDQAGYAQTANWLDVE